MLATFWFFLIFKEGSQPFELNCSQFGGSKHAFIDAAAQCAEQCLCNDMMSVCLSHRSTAAGLLLSALGQKILIDSCGRAACAVLQALVLSSKCG